MANNAVITQKQNKNTIMILVTSSDKLPIICIKMNKGSVWCFPPKFWNALIYLPEIPIVKIKYNIRFSSRNWRGLHFRKVYVSSFIILISKWNFLELPIFFFKKKACVWYLVTRTKNLILTGMKHFIFLIFVAFGLVILACTEQDISNT